MEDTLGVMESLLINEIVAIVLILVLMEDTLGDVARRDIRPSS